MKQAKKKSGSRAALVVLAIVAVLVLLASVAGLVYVLYNNDKPAQTEDVSAGLAGYPEDYQIAFAQAWQRNQDFKGYLTLEGTSLATTVVQAADNSKYQQQGFDGSAGSTAYLDYRSDVKTPGSQLLIYMPNADVQPMYGELANYKNPDYYKRNPIITFNSVYKNAKYKVFSVVLLPAGSDPIPYQSFMDSGDKAQFVNLVQKAMEYSVINIPVDMMDTDKLLTVVSEDLSLRDENGNPAKVLIFARQIRAGESESVDTSNVNFKANKYLPEDWYNQIIQSDYDTMIKQQIRKEAAAWFTEYELSQIKDEELETLLNARKAELKKYLSEDELRLPVDEKLYLYEQRKNESLKLNIDDYTAKVDEKVTLKLENKYLDDNAEYVWKSSDDSVLSISPNGKSAVITGKKVGTATVTVSSGGSSSSCICRIKAANTLVINPSSKTIAAGNNFNITASDNISKVSSSNIYVAKVDYYGKTATVYGVAAGDATITITGKNGASATCKVKVEDKGFAMDKYSMTLEKGGRSNVYITYGEAVNWYSNNTGVARVSIMNNGQAVQVEAVGVGTTSIVATSRYGTQLSCSVTVTDNSIALSSSAMNMEIGGLYELRVTRGSAYGWYSSNESVARVYPVGDGSYAQVEAVGSGSATISAFSANGTSAYCSVAVSKPQAALTISPYSMTVNTGELRNISVTSGSATNWVSSDPSVAEVYVIGDGSMAQVEGIRAGYATITVYDALGGWVTCDVTVQQNNPPLVIGPANIYLNEGDWEEITVSSGYAASWESTNNNVVQVVGDSGTGGVSIRAIYAGTAQVIAYDIYGNAQRCYVTVEKPYVPEPIYSPILISPASMTLQQGDWGEIKVLAGSAAKWETNDSSVLTLYDSGDGVIRFKAAGAGYADLLVYGTDGSYAICSVTVNPW